MDTLCETPGMESAGPKENHGECYQPKSHRAQLQSKCDNSQLSTIHTYNKKETVERGGAKKAERERQPSLQEKYTYKRHK